MPYINTKVNISLSRKQKENMKSALGEAITLIPGKTEKGLMVSFEESCPIYLGGNGLTPAAYIDVKLLSGASRDAKAKLCAKITEIIADDLSIAPERIYITFEDIDEWGANGSLL